MKEKSVILFSKAQISYQEISNAAASNIESEKPLPDWAFTPAGKNRNFRKPTIKKMTSFQVRAAEAENLLLEA